MSRFSDVLACVNTIGLVALSVVVCISLKKKPDEPVRADGPNVAAQLAQLQESVDALNRGKVEGADSSEIDAKVCGAWCVFRDFEDKILNKFPKKCLSNILDEEKFVGACAKIFKDHYGIEMLEVCCDELRCRYKEMNGIEPSYDTANLGLLNQYAELIKVVECMGKYDDGLGRFVGYNYDSCERAITAREMRSELLAYTNAHKRERVANLWMYERVSAWLVAENADDPVIAGLAEAYDEGRRCLKDIFVPFMNDRKNLEKKLEAVEAIIDGRDIDVSVLDYYWRERLKTKRGGVLRYICRDAFRRALGKDYFHQGQVGHEDGSKDDWRLLFV